MLSDRIRQRGNIFAMMFATVAMLGVAGGAAMNFIVGPITTASKVTSRNMAETDLMTNARLVVMNAATIIGPEGYAPGDVDGDGYIEPVPFVPTSDPSCNITLPGDGGCLPMTLGASLTDPWGTPYAYCVWDHGDPNMSTNRIQGGQNTSAAVIAIVSAGVNKRFETPCMPYDAGDPNRVLVNPEGVGDDYVRTYTYDAAVAGAGGLWELKADDGATAVIDKKLEIGNVAGGTGFAFDTQTGTGEFPYVKTDFIASKSGGTTPIELMDNIALKGNWLSGDGTDKGVFVDTSGNVGIGTNSPSSIFQIWGTGGLDDDVDIRSYGNAGWDQAGAIKFRRYNGTPIAPTAIDDGARLGGVSFYGHTGLSSLKSAALYVDAANDYSATGRADISFHTYNGTNFAERMRLMADGNVGVGTTAPDPSAKMDIASATQGFLPPRMTTVQRDAIDDPAIGLMIFNVTEKAPEFFDGTEWLSMLGGGKVACATPWGAVVSEGESVTAYQAASVAYGETCSSQTRTCTNGALSGVYAYQACTVATDTTPPVWQTAANLPDATEGTAYSVTLSATDNSGGSLSYNAAETFPAWLSLNTSNGHLSGTPTAGGTFTFAIRVQDQAGNSAYRAFTLKVTPLDACAGTPTPGTVCADGTIYAGKSPDGNVPMYTTAADQSSGAYWGTYNYTTGSTSRVTGRANTDDILSHIVSGHGSYNPINGYEPNAIILCKSLTVGGHNDWYLPAIDELDVLFENKGKGALAGTFNETGSYPAGYYWSSSEYNSHLARLQRFSDGNEANTSKTLALAVRCVRR